MTNKVAKMDEEHLAAIRKNVSQFVKSCAKKYDRDGIKVLDVAPQDHEGVTPYFKQAKVDTLDIDHTSNATYIADLCQNNKKIIPDNSFDFVVCTEVLEHTLQPFGAVEEIHRILKPGGFALVSTPYNFRIHGPLPDCWRFTEHGLRALFSKFDSVKIVELVTKDRFLMPIHYTTIARKAR